MLVALAGVMFIISALALAQLALRLAERLPVKPVQTQIFILPWFWYQTSSQNAENL